MGGERRFDLNLPQIVGGALATMTAAVAASYLGVAGTVIGAAVMSVGSTVGGAVYTHYLRRTGDQITLMVGNETQDDHPRKVEGEGELATAARATVRVAAREEARAEGAGRLAPVDPDAPTSVIPVLAAAVESADGLDGLVVETNPATVELPRVVDGSATAELPRITGDSPTDELPKIVDGPVTAELPRIADGPRGSGGPHANDGPRVKVWMLAVTALVTFVLSMGAILGFEKLSGQPVSSTLKGEKGSGTSLNPGAGERDTSPEPVRPSKPSRPAVPLPSTPDRATSGPVTSPEPEREEKPEPTPTPPSTRTPTPAPSPSSSPTQDAPSPEPSEEQTDPLPDETGVPDQEDSPGGGPSRQPDSGVE
ncbi:hypothetical protein [Streptosporangium sp. NPDC000396]|uniref:hypothetical protein n=1 Tax=Streptosporangium sp. NPDC000396 TaxID=3366185 RepID=UPI0036C699D1